MKNLLYNIGYFIKEAKTIIGLNLASNVFSILSTGLIFFILAMVATGWWVSSRVVEAIKGEAEISVYYKDSTVNSAVVQLSEKIKDIDGVKEVRLISEDEAYGRMENILGKDAEVLAYLEDNPFSPFIEVKIDLGKMDTVLELVGAMPEIQQLRDNREVLERIKNLASILKLLGYFIVIAVGACTLVIISHIIRLGINNNREQINTLRLLGAPEAFIAFPFLLVGLALTLGGGILSSFLASFTIQSLYARMAGPLPFIPLPPMEPMVSGITALILILSSVLGIGGSLLGLAGKREG